MATAHTDGPWAALRAEHAEAIAKLETYADILAEDGFDDDAEEIVALIARMKATQAATTTGESS